MIMRKTVSRLADDEFDILAIWEIPAREGFSGFQELVAGFQQFGIEREAHDRASYTFGIINPAVG